MIRPLAAIDRIHDVLGDRRQVVLGLIMIMLPYAIGLAGALAGIRQVHPAILVPMLTPTILGWIVLIRLGSR